MKAYSLDLRLRVVDAIARGEGTLEEVAAYFRVGLTFVKRMLRVHRQSASLAPKPHGGGAQPALNDWQRERLRAAVETRPDATLKELQEVVAAECQVRVSEATLCRELQRLHLPRKKKSFVASERSKKNAAPFGARSPLGTPASSSSWTKWGVI